VDVIWELDSVCVINGGVGEGHVLFSRRVLKLGIGKSKVDREDLGNHTCQSIRCLHACFFQLQEHHIPINTRIRNLNSHGPTPSSTRSSSRNIHRRGNFLRSFNALSRRDSNLRTLRHE